MGHVYCTNNSPNCKKVPVLYRSVKYRTGTAVKNYIYTRQWYRLSQCISTAVPIFKQPDDINSDTFRILVVMLGGKQTNVVFLRG
jgi:hypothetical protein